MRRQRKGTGRWTAWGAFLALSAGLAGPAWAASFQGLGSLPGDNESYAHAVSADGSVIVGISSTDTAAQAFRWTASGGMVGLGYLPGTSSSGAVDVSADGSVVVGGSGNQAFRWTSGGGMVGLGFLSGDPESTAAGVSADGLVVVGWSGRSSSSKQAFRWTSGGGMVGLGYLPGHNYVSVAYDVSGDGLVVAGDSATQPPVTVEAFRWTAATGMVGLGVVPGYSESLASAVSADGSVVVGRSTYSTFAEAFRWTAATGMVGLGVGASDATGVSGDGRTVVGFGFDGSFGYPFLWDAARGVRNLPQVLTDLGVDTTGWDLFFPTAISADGLTIVGFGYNPSGQEEAWVARGPFDVPHIESDPQPGLIEAGRLTTLTLVDGGSPPYAWYKDDVPLSDNPPRMTGTNTRTLTFSPVQETDAGSYHVSYDDGAKAPAQTPPFYMPVLPEGTLPALSTAGLILLALALSAVALTRRRHWFGYVSGLAHDTGGDTVGRLGGCPRSELTHE